MWPHNENETTRKECLSLPNPARLKAATFMSHSAAEARKVVAH
jgi:hypothetical protein